MKPRVLCIGGWDPRALAGLAVDLRFAEGLEVHALGVITAVTAQGDEGGSFEPVSEASLVRQLEAAGALAPSAIKIGMLGSNRTIAVVHEWLAQPRGYVVLDPVMTSSTGAALLPAGSLERLRALLPRVDLVTPNLDEAERLCGWERGSLTDAAGAERAASHLRGLGARAVLVKGGHAQGALSSDLYATKSERAWLSNDRQSDARGTGCALSASIAAAMAWGEPRIYDPLDAIVVAKACVTRALRDGALLGNTASTRSLGAACWPSSLLPWITSSAPAERPRFAKTEEIGFYPIVDTADDVVRLARAGVRTVQLRIKDASSAALRDEIARAIAATRDTPCRLFINDHLELAIELGAFGVHLGQEDLVAAGHEGIRALAAAGLQLGVSTHSYSELARAIAVNPSYIALGPIYPTRLKKMRFAPQGADRLQEWRWLIDRPLVAIGGITLERVHAMWLADGVSVVADLKQGELETRARMFMEAVATRRG